MIFNNTILTEGELTTKESPYDLTFEDALMHVYENECNYNELMKAVGISELRYYNDTGKELFVEEANAFEKFINAAKGFFNKIIEGIKSIFNKFMAFIRSKLSDDKKFLAKYESTLKAKTAADLKNGNEVLKIKGYPFTKLGNWTPKSVLTGGQLNASDANFSNVDTTGTAKLSRVRNDSDADNAMDVQRGNIAEGLTDDNIDKLTKAEFAKTLKENLIGTEKQEIAMERINKLLESEPEFIEALYGDTCFRYDHPEIYSETCKTAFEDYKLNSIPVHTLNLLLGGKVD